MKTESLQAAEDLAARGATAPRVTLDDIKNSVAAVYFVNGAQLVPFEAHGLEGQRNIGSLSLLTICVVLLQNGFTVIGQSAPASAENFDKTKGEDFAYEDALRKIWPLMGFALRDRIYRDLVKSEVFRELGAANLEHNGTDLVGDQGQQQEGQQQLPPIDDDATLDSAPSEYVYDLARTHNIPFGQDTTRETDLAALKAKRDSLVAQQQQPQDGQPSAIPDDETLEGMLDQPIKDLALAHALDYADRRDAIDKLKIKRQAMSGQPNPV